MRSSKLTRNLFIATSLLSFTVSGHKSEFQNAPSKELSWLVGHWERTNNKPGQHAHERWTSKLKGYGVTMKEQDTLFTEKFWIQSDNGELFYVADVPENKKPVYFKFINLNKEGFTCENLQHDFPKRIAYVVDGSNLKVTISGDGKSVDFHFRKK